MKRILPGDMNPIDTVDQMLRVNQAGEYGATQIYAGQLAALKAGPARDIVQHMYEQELHHLRTFNKLLISRRVRPTVLSPLWRVAGFALGFITAKMGPKAAMACTVAVEEVIDDHYHTQEQWLVNHSEEKGLKQTISQFRQEELEHRDIGLQQGAQDAPFYKTLRQGIKVATKTAIWLSKRI